MGSAIESGSLESVRLLVEMRANLRARLEGLSLARFAAECGEDEIRTYLLGMQSRKSAKHAMT